ncbi:molybdate ABC transporter permease subunit [Arenicella sp.]|nr:molybdate ABC transporter permease subunit [Arenicella sp.]
MISAADIIALGVTLKLALITTLLLMSLGLPLAWWLSRSNWRYKFVIEALVAMPLILPPTVLGFYCLLLLGSNGPLGGLLQLLGAQPLAFTFTGLVIGSMIYSLPFVVQPLVSSFNSIPQRQLEVAATLGAAPLDQILSVAIPLARPGLITAAVLGFAHTIGEFGVVLMIGGSIPGETKVLSIAIYEHVESLQYAQAHWLSAGLLVVSFILLVAVYAINRQFRIRVI